MLNEERRRGILELLQSDGRVLVRDLSDRIQTSLITIRKDLEFLHHTGAIWNAPMEERCRFAPALCRTARWRKRSGLHGTTNCASRRRRRRMIQEGQVIILDSGTTTTAIARACKQFRSLTVITNGTNIAEELAGTSVEVILTGGTLRKNSFSLVGPLAEESLRQLSADMLFLAVDGFDTQYGLTTPNQLEARVNRVMAKNGAAHHRGLRFQ